jgi:hypothetical protein
MAVLWSSVANNQRNDCFMPHCCRSGFLAEWGEETREFSCYVIGVKLFFAPGRPFTTKFLPVTRSYVLLEGIDEITAT